MTETSRVSLVNNVVVGAKAFDAADCGKYLDRDVISEGYQPVQRYIQNSSDKDYVFSLNRVSLPTARAEEVSGKVHTDTIARAAGYGAAALFFLPLAIGRLPSGDSRRSEAAYAERNLKIGKKSGF